MKTKLSKYLAVAITCIFSLSFILTPHAFADDRYSICDNPNVSEQIKAANGCAGTTTPTLQNTVINILNAIIGILGLVAVVFVIIGGVQYMTSTGDPGKVKKAKDTILYALIGLVVCVLSFAIVNWAISAIGGSGNPPAQQQEGGEKPVKPGEQNNNREEGPNQREEQ